MKKILLFIFFAFFLVKVNAQSKDTLMVRYFTEFAESIKKKNFKEIAKYDYDFSKQKEIVDTIRQDENLSESMRGLIFSLHGPDEYYSSRKNEFRRNAHHNLIRKLEELNFDFKNMKFLYFNYIIENYSSYILGKKLGTAPISKVTYAFLKITDGNRNYELHFNTNEVSSLVTSTHFYGGIIDSLNEVDKKNENTLAYIQIEFKRCLNCSINYETEK
jgi:hypothetical protein